MNKKLNIRTDALVLRKETLRQLDPELLTEVVGGDRTGARSRPHNQPTSHQSQHSSRA